MLACSGQQGPAPVRSPARKVVLCNDFGNRIPYDAYVEAFSQTRLPLKVPGGDPEPRAAGRHLAHRDRAGPPFGRGRDRVRATALGLRARTAQSGAGDQLPLGRATVSQRTLPRAGFALLRVHRDEVAEIKWRFTKAGEDWFCFAGLWRPAAGEVPEAFTLLTTAPGPDVAPIHDRQMVVLERADWLAWLELSRPEAELLCPLPAGSLQVEQVR